MNGNDISRLSYKELQALAVKYRVPGNIKKELLIKIIRAARSRDNGEVDRLLSDLKQTRKKRTRKIKAEKLGITSTPIQSPDNVMAEDYYHSQQQQQQQQRSPYQWVGAEEEIVSREDDKIPHYEEFRQFLLRKIQREFQTYNTPHNPQHESTIVDLRTTASSSTAHSFPVDIVNCSKPNLIGINESNSCIYPLTNHIQYHHLQKDSSKSTCGSILLKKMLQAPVGTNLGELASPVFGDYRVWPVEQYHSENILDNSDTLTAESVDNDNEDNLVINTDCYGVLNNVRDEYLLHDTNFKNVQDIDQMSNVLTDQNSNQYHCNYANNDLKQNYQTWTITNVMDSIDESYIDTDISTSKVLHAIYLDNPVTNANNGNSNYRYHISENVYNDNPTVLNIDSSEDPLYYSPTIMSNVQSTSTDQAYLENHNKYIGETREYFQMTGSAGSINFASDVPALNQTLPNNIPCNSEVTYQYSNLHDNHQSYVTMSQSFESRQSNDLVTSQDMNICKDSVTERVQSCSDGMLDPFWPKWSHKKLSDNNLENILNFNISKRIDYTKIDQTSCIYCYTAPIVTHKAVLPTDVCSQQIKLVAEQRHHSFSPYWLLYNDSSAGMRMANIQSNADECSAEQVWMIRATSMSNNNNSNIKDSIDESEDSINDVWMNDYSKYRMPLQKDINSCEVINAEVSESLFSTIHTESNLKNETISTSQMQEDITY
ncbi:uncharacterized protein LOC124950349 isoform X2 [Vespa velutina]|uniref:uncharacterized protein LOC124424160 n=1 Tax=Vespa crabro TaxID=7445 RepID=UPI001F0126FC|nr:uncharacterized protein LOC124424160 [Vespa crabro]XP_047352849.1 uncharacterized protein LOC124950349 isoform X2 [Vespa velutina]